MTVGAAAAGGILAGTIARKKQEQRKEQLRLQEQQRLQQLQYFIPDQYVNSSQVLPPNHIASTPKFSGGDGFNPLLETIKQKKAREAEHAWKEAKNKPGTTDAEKRRLLYDRYNQEEKAKKSACGASITSDVTSTVGSGTASFLIPEPITAIAVSGGIAAASKPLGVWLTNAADGVYKLARPKSPERPAIKKKVDEKMERIKKRREKDK